MEENKREGEEGERERAKAMAARAGKKKGR